MRRLSSLLLAVAIGLSFTACEGDDSSGSFGSSLGQQSEPTLDAETAEELEKLQNGVPEGLEPPSPETEGSDPHSPDSQSPDTETPDPDSAETEAPEAGSDIEREAAIEKCMKEAAKAYEDLDDGSQSSKDLIKSLRKLDRTLCEAEVDLELAGG